MGKRSPIPTFYLYGEPHRAVAPDFIHVEPLDDRSRPSGWSIAPHAHADLCQLILIGSGGGRMRADALDVAFVAPCLLVVPATTVHAFRWEEESVGTVLSLAGQYVADLARHDRSIATVFDAPRLLALDDGERDAIDSHARGLRRELGWSIAGHRAAVDAHALALLVILLRKAAVDGRPATKPGAHAVLVARFRERIEQRFRWRESIADHARALGTSETALRVACARVAAASPARMLDQRALLEAKRSLLYSHLSVAEVGYSLNFPDPAYFSRFFTRHVGVPPSRYRHDPLARASAARPAADR